MPGSGELSSNPYTEDSGAACTPETAGLLHIEPSARQRKHEGQGEFV